MSNYLAAIWKCRYFWLSLARSDLRTRYRRSVLGIAWSLLQPIAMTAILCAVFHTVFNMNIREYAPSLMVGMCFWNFITAVTLQGGQCLFQGEAYIRQFPAPLAIYPLRTVLVASFHFTISLGVAICLRWLLQGFGSFISVPDTIPLKYKLMATFVNTFDNVAALPALIPALVLLVVFGWAVAVLSGFLTAYFADMQHLSEVGLQMLFYGTPIIYPASTLRDRGLGFVIDFNPVAVILQLLRDPILNGTVPPTSAYGIAFLTVSIVSGLAVLALVRLQETIIFQL